MQTRELHESVGLVTADAVSVPLVGVTVTGTIIGRAARVKIRQRFENRGDKAIEAVYKFPLPESSSVCGFTVATGDKVLRGQVEEREKAFKLYDEALSQGDGAYLLDEERPNIFTLSVGNVNARNTVDVEIEYVTLLDTNSDEVRFSLPTTISPRYVPADMPDQGGIPVNALVNPKFQLDVPYGVNLHLDVLGREDIAGLECASHSIRTNYSARAIAVEFSSTTVAMDRDFVLTIKHGKGFESKGYAFSDEAHTYVQIDFAPKFVSAAVDSGSVSKRVAAEVVFLLDCSGSMNGSSIQQARKALELFLRGMEAGTRFNIFRFGSTYEKLFPESVQYDAANLDAALKLLGRVEADLGGTELLPPLRDIYGKGPADGGIRSIILLTDGEVGNEDDILKLAQSEPRTKIFTVGIGHGPNDHLLKKAASLSSGASESVAPGERIEPRVLRLFKKVMAGGVDDLKVDWSAVAEQAPLKPVAYQGECVSVFARFPNRSTVPCRVKLAGKVNGVDMIWQVSIDNTDGAVALPLLWARNRISDLENGIGGIAGSRQEERKDTAVKEKIVALSKQYGLLSRETSFVAVESRVEGEKTTGETVLRKVPVMLTKDWGGLGGGAGVLHCIPRSYGYDQSAAKPHVMFCSPPTGRMTAGHEQVRQASMQYDSLLDSPMPNLENSDRLADILALQTAEGGFLVAREEQANSVGVHWVEMREAAAKLKGVVEADRVKLVCTALLLALLESDFGDRRDEWYALTEKSRRWFGLEMKCLNPTVDGKSLEQWALSGNARL